MFGISMLRRAPRLFLLLLLFITVFLLAFLLLGCTTASSTFSSVYLVELLFNKTSELFPNIELAYKGSNSSQDLGLLVIRANYLGVCVNIDDSSQTCTGYSSLSQLSGYTGVSIVPTSSNSTQKQLDLVAILKQFLALCHPHVLMGAIVLTLVLMVTILWSLMPLPKKEVANLVSLVLAFGDVLLWGLGAMLQHEATTVAKNLVQLASMHTVTAAVGKRADAMTWTGFSFLLVVVGGLFVLQVCDMRRAKEPKGKF